MALVQGLCPGYSCFFCCYNSTNVPYSSLFLNLSLTKVQKGVILPTIREYLLGSDDHQERRILMIYRIKTNVWQVTESIEQSPFGESNRCSDCNKVSYFFMQCKSSSQYSQEPATCSVYYSDEYSQHLLLISLRSIFILFIPLLLGISSDDCSWVFPPKITKYFPSPYLLLVLPVSLFLIWSSS
jgi:hypothetical protein